MKDDIRSEEYKDTKKPGAIQNFYNCLDITKHSEYIFRIFALRKNDTINH